MPATITNNPRPIDSPHPIDNNPQQLQQQPTTTTQNNN